MPKVSETPKELRFILTSTLGHEVILTDDEIAKLLRICYTSSKSLLTKISPFVDLCRYEHNCNRNKTG
jgi:hypothetical protein